jgi:sulfite reductase (ferredoxin)
MDGARALVRYRKPNVSDDNAEMVADFRALYFDTKLFFDKYAGARFAEYMFLAFENRDRQHTEETAHQLIEESGLFMEAVLACYSRVGAIPASELPVVPA